MIQARTRQARNYNVRTAVRKAIRSLIDAVKAGDKPAAEKQLSPTYKVIDTAVKKNVMHRKTGDRRKSTLARMVAGMKKA